MRSWPPRVLLPAAAVSCGLLADERGQDVVEYGLIIAVIALIVLIGTLTFGNEIQPWFGHLAGAITTTGTS